MTRRLLFAGTALGVSLLPACTAPAPYRANVHPPVASRTNANGVVVSKMAKKSDVFADARETAPTVVARQTVPLEVPAPLPEGPSHEVKLEEPKLPEAKQVEPAAPEIVLTPARPLPVEVAKPTETKPIAESKPVIRPVSLPEPIPDKDGIIRAHDPVIRTGSLPLVEMQTTPTKVEPPILVPTLPMKSEPAPILKPIDTPKIPIDDLPTITAPAPAIKPPTLPPGVIGSSVSNASPEINSLDPMLSPVPEIRPVSATDESPLLRAVRAYQQNRPDEAVQHLKDCDPASQQMLLSLMPSLVRLSEGKLASMKPEELDQMVEQLSKAPNQLRSKASLKATNVRLCREVHNFAHIEPFPEKHTFHPGDIVYLYMELANFSCVGDPKSGYAISLVSNLELRDSSDKVVWKADPKEEPDRVSTPPQDYYRNFRLCVPSVPAGSYTLRLKTTDQPTGRTFEKTLEVRVGAK